MLGLLAFLACPVTSVFLARAALRSRHPDRFGLWLLSGACLTTFAGAVILTDLVPLEAWFLSDGSFAGSTNSATLRAAHWATRISMALALAAGAALGMRRYAAAVYAALPLLTCLGIQLQWGAFFRWA